MARELLRLASSDPPPSEPEGSICRCGRPMAWVVEPCKREGCHGFWAWRCPTRRYDEVDDTLELAAHGLSHDLRAREVLAEGLHSCPRCGARDWVSGRWWVPSNLHALRFTCQICGAELPVSEGVLYSLERSARGVEVARPPRGEPSRPCGCGRSAVYAGDNGDWPGPECACCGGTVGPYNVANWARPLCDDCQPNPKADEIVRLIADGTEDRRLRWLERGKRVRVIIARAMPRLGPAGQRLSGETLRDRRLRLARAIAARLGKIGWTFVGTRFTEPNDYEARAGIHSESRWAARSPGTASWAS